MQIFLDTAERNVAEPLLATGLFAGVTTNPTILQRAGLRLDDLPEVYRWATAAGAEEVFLQAWGDDEATLLDCSLRLRCLGPQVTVKLLASRDGASVCRELARRCIPTLLTGIYSPVQAILALAAQATWIAPYVGKLQDAGGDAVRETATMHTILAAQTGATRVLAASLRDWDTVVGLARHGVTAFTLGPAVAEQMLDNELTDDARTGFDRAIAAMRPPDPGPIP